MHAFIYLLVQQGSFKLLLSASHVFFSSKISAHLIEKLLVTVDLEI